MASCIFRRVSNLGLDAALFLTDFKFLKLRGLPPFYLGVFRSWALFKRNPGKSSNSLFWLLKEPLIYGARLDVCSGATPGLLTALCQSKTLTLHQLVDKVGPALSDVGAVCSLLNIQSTRVAQKVLECWRQRLSGRERGLLMDYSQGTEPEHDDPFPEVYISPELGEVDGPLLKGCRELCLNTAKKKALYQNCVKVTNRKGLCDRAPTAWTSKLGGN